MAKKLPPGITQLKSGRYQVRPYDRAARRKGPAHGFDTLSEAVAYKEKVEAGKIRASKRQWTCAEWVEEWTNNPAYKRRKPSTNIHNAERVAKFAEDFGDLDLHQLDLRMARSWAMENMSRVPAVRAMLNDAVGDDILDRNPFAGIRTNKGPGRKHIHPLTEKELRLLAEGAYEKWPDWPCMGSMVIVAAYTGVRLGELLAMRWSDIDWEKGSILVERQWVQKQRTYGPTKNGLPRTIALLEPAAVALRRLDRSSPAGNGLVWYSPREKRIEQSLHDYYWRQARERFFGKITEERRRQLDLEWHALRHFTASWLVDKGAQPHDVANQLGHTDGGKLVQELYGHLYPDNSITRLQALAA